MLQVFRLLKALLSLGYGAKELGWSIITFQAQAVRSADPVNPIHASLHGFVGSMAKEFPRWHIRLLDLETGLDAWPKQV